MWICEFCEYERIFGTPPAALIRQYEIKDRKIRKQEAERRRLLEKAKMKGRKGKKGSKAKAQATQQNQQPAHHQDQRPPPPSHQNSNSQDTQSEDYYEDGEYDDGYHEDDLPVQSNAHGINHTPIPQHSAGNMQLAHPGGIHSGQTVT
jgi:hypothetical protein